MNSGQYYASREWALLRERVRKRSGGYCERGHTAPYEQTHHLTYERFGHELLEDLLAVCGDCHEYLSGKRDDDPVALPQDPDTCINEAAIATLERFAELANVDARSLWAIRAAMTAVLSARFVGGTLDYISDEGIRDRLRSLAPAFSAPELMALYQFYCHVAVRHLRVRD